MTRRYRSKVREEQASRTREALLDACESLLLETSVEEVTLPAVARRAGVTKPTAYSYFPDNDALIAGFLAHLRGRIGMDVETLTAFSPAELSAALRENYRRFEENEQLLRRVMESPSYDRVRLSRNIDRPAMPVWQGMAPERVLRQRIGAIHLLIAPSSWRWLRDTWGLSGEEAARTAAWAMQALIDALAASGVEPRRQTTTKADAVARLAQPK